MTDDESTRQATLSEAAPSSESSPDLSVPSGDGVHLEWSRRVAAYAEEVTAGGWEFVQASTDAVTWTNPDGLGVYRLENRRAGWKGVRANREVPPSYTDDLRAALDRAGEYLAEHPVGGADP